nr:MAG TPA: hypothetical protein [Caudoviricetes sp.]
MSPSLSDCLYYNAQVSKRKHFFLENRKKFPLGVYKSKMMRYD